MHMRLPSLRACRYIAERRTIPKSCAGLAAAATMAAGERVMRSQRGYDARFERRPYSYRDSHFMPLERRMKAADTQNAGENHEVPSSFGVTFRFKTYAFHHEIGICHELETEKMRYRLTDFVDSDVFRRLNRRQYQTATRCLSLIFVH